MYEKNPAHLLSIHVLTGRDFIVDDTKTAFNYSHEPRKCDSYAEELGQNYKPRILPNR